MLSNDGIVPNTIQYLIGKKIVYFQLAELVLDSITDLVSSKSKLTNLDQARMTIVDQNSWNLIESLIKLNRTTKGTAMNTNSSRSHLFVKFSYEKFFERKMDKPNNRRFSRERECYYSPNSRQK